MADSKTDGDTPIIIKKYANRRLYNTDTSSYITLDDLGHMVRENVDFQVVDAKTGADITHAILTQIIMEEETNGEQMLPIGFLRQLISMYGNQMQAMMPGYLEASMDHFRQNQMKLQEAFTASMGGDAFKQVAQTNMAMIKAATGAFMPQVDGASSETSSKDDDLEALRAQMAAMQERLDKMGK
ncbi:polyhydroxyalkanoate synthesis repressor PhaR [Paraurantiacibacter namhicola]|uniref:PHB/PHA accumulation regulator DNA-binding domain protein n=1 Tax=Paraurantiacibacter namhicola TaxID=645517 RepID=A0A1C7D9J2_9SPHN|nr:polyhydroxyalkanoate synthesis repressor PhaR [Paraurantiacibacter namhicola]ANU07981.1 PHB/PHA accumulation regulator DNA-binding domain protein [Paraurantiacibacter namhicola]